MKTIKAWAIVDKNGDIEKLSLILDGMLMVYTTKKSAYKRKMSVEKVIRVEIREVEELKSGLDEYISMTAHCRVENIELHSEVERLERRLEDATNEVEVLKDHRGIIGNVLKYVHFVLCGTDEIKSDRCDEIQNAADAVMSEIAELRDENSRLKTRLKELMECE